MSESNLVNEIMREVGKFGAIFRTNAGTYYTKTGQRVSGLPKGFSDVLFIGNDGIACFIECKLPGNKPTPEQDSFIERMKSLGARAGIAHSVADAANICGLKIRCDLSVAELLEDRND